MPKSQTHSSNSVKIPSVMQSDSQQTVSRLSARLLAAQQSGSLDMRVREVVQRNVGTQIPQRLKARQQGFTCAD